VWKNLYWVTLVFLLYRNTLFRPLFTFDRRQSLLLLAGSVILGAMLSTGTVWSLSEIANGLMAIPNLIILLYFTPELVKLTKDYRKQNGRESAAGGTYENFHQRQPL